MTQITGRVTGKKLVKWLNEEFERLEIEDYEVISVEATRYTTDQYEGGAHRLNIKFRNKTIDIDSIFSVGYFHSYYSVGQIDDHVRSGYKLTLRLPYQRFSITDMELDLKRI